MNYYDPVYDRQNRGPQRVVQFVMTLSAAIVIGILFLGAYVLVMWDREWDVPLPIFEASRDTASVARGEYLVYGPARCVMCHSGSEADAVKALASHGRVPLIGGQRFAAAPIGAIYASNLTPDRETGIGRYTDAEISRAIRSAVLPDGRATVQALMPYDRMSDDDVDAIVSFLRAQPPVRHRVPSDEWTIVGKVVKSLLPSFMPHLQIHPPSRAPAARPTADRGAYLVALADCASCHTRVNQVTFQPAAPLFSGGDDMGSASLEGADPNALFHPPNLTPAPNSALSRFADRAAFIARFRAGGRQHPGSPMPWEAYARMTPEDLGAIYEYLRTLPPVDTPAQQQVAHRQ